MPLKLFLAVAAAAAIGVGLVLPVHNRSAEAAQQSQIETLEVRRG
jgi:ABC-type sugar transport system substrate-binding protein